MLAPGKIINFYADGFRSMTVGRKLWAIIIIKLIVIFAILKVFFFQGPPQQDTPRQDAVRTSLIEQASKP